MLKKVLLFLKHHLHEWLLLLVIISFFLVQHLDAVYMMAILLLYLAIVFLNDAFLDRIKKGIEDIKRNRQLGILFLIVIALMFIWQFRLESIIFIALFIAFALYRWNSRIIASGAFISLASSLLLLILKQGVLAEQMTVYAYYFFVMAVVLVIIEHKRSLEKSDTEEKTLLGLIKAKKIGFVDSIYKK